MPPLIEDKYECSTCSLSVNSLVQLQQHFKGRKHKAKMPANSGNMSKPTDSTLVTKSTSFSHPFGHQNVLSKKHIQAKAHVMAAAVSPYNSKRKVIMKYPKKEKSCAIESSNQKSQPSLSAASQKTVDRSVNLQCVNSVQNQQEIYFSYKDPTDSNNNLITTTIASKMSTNQPTVDKIMKIQPTISSSQNNIPKSHNFSIDNILQTGNNTFNKSKFSNCIDEKNMALHQLNTEFPSSIELPLQNINPKIDGERELGLKSNAKNPNPTISVRKDLMDSGNNNQVDNKYCNIQPPSNFRQSNTESIMQQPVEELLTLSTSKQDATIVHSPNSNTVTKTSPTSPVIRAPLEPISNLKIPITSQNITRMPSSSNINWQNKKKDDLSLKCYTCNKDVFDYLGNSKSLIYDHLIFGRASCRTCSKTVSCSGFTKLRNSNSSCCKSDQLAYTNNPVFYLIGELENCEKNPCYYLAEYMMKIKVLWIYMPWCQAVLEVKKFVKNPCKVPSFIFKGWDESNSLKQKSPLNQKEDIHTRREVLKDKEIKMVKSENKENENPSMKRSLTDNVIEHKDRCKSPPAKKTKGTLRTFRIKQEFIDDCEIQAIETPNDCTDSTNHMTNKNKKVREGKVEIQHKQHNPNYKQKNENKSKLDNPTDTFAPIIVDVCSIQDPENHSFEGFNEKFNIDNALELSCGSTIMTPDASPNTSPIDNTKLATDNKFAKNSIHPSHTNLSSLRGKICVTKYMKDVAKINSNSLVSEKTIEECPMCYQKLSLSKMTVNTENMVLKFVCSCKLNIHILPNKNGKILWPFNDYDYKKSVRNQKIRKSRVRVTRSPACPAVTNPARQFSRTSRKVSRTLVKGFFFD